MTNTPESSDMDLEKRRALLGERFLVTFHRLLRTARIHQDNNQLLMECAQSFIDAISFWCKDEDNLTIRATHGRFFLQNEKLLYRRDMVSFIHEMLHYFEVRGFQELRFDAEVKDAPLTEILAFARFLNDADQKEDPLAYLLEEQEKESFPWVEIVEEAEVVQEEKKSPEESRLERNQKARMTYSYALSSIKEVAQKIASQRRVGLRKIKRVVQGMVDLLMEDESVLIGLSTVRDYDDYTYTHSVNVAILSLFLGKRIGLSRVSLTRLGICGLVHDLGKIEVPIEILNKPGRLNKNDLEEMQKHPLRSVRQIIKLRASKDLKAKILLPPFEHHLKYDLSGYPKTDIKRPMSLFGRILAIADVFDAMTSPRVYRPEVISPDLALGLMLDKAGKDFDPILLKVFINMLGTYPVGTVLQLDTKELGLVMDTPKEGDPTRPRVMLLVDDKQGGFGRGKVVSLAERNPLTGKFRRNFVKSFHPSTFGIQPAELLL